MQERLIGRDGEITLDSPAGRQLGFTSDKFDGWLWRKGRVIYVSFIISKQEGKGQLAKLFQTIWKYGFTIRVPTPSKRMIEICKKNGFTYRAEYDKTFRETVDILEGKPQTVQLQGS